MGLDKVKKRYGQTLRNPPEVTERITRNGRKVRITTTHREMTMADLDKEERNEYREAGFDIEKLQAAGFDPDVDDPDDFCTEDFGEE